MRCLTVCFCVLAIPIKEPVLGSELFLSPNSPGIQRYFDEIGDLSKCPTGHGFRPLSNLAPVGGIFVEFGKISKEHETNLKYVRDLAEIMAEELPDIQLNILIPNDVSLQEKAELAFFREKYYSFVNRIELPHLHSAWIQDFLTFGVTANNSPAVLALGSETETEEFANVFGIKKIRSNRAKPTEIDAGGNIMGSFIFHVFVPKGDVMHSSRRVSQGFDFWNAGSMTPSEADLLQESKFQANLYREFPALENHKIWFRQTIINSRGQAYETNPSP